MELKEGNERRVREKHLHLEFCLVPVFSTCLQDCTVICRAVTGGGALCHHSQAINFAALQLI